ncbi:secreted frizzled-related protein 4 [Patella vulgata]|uniref:secreted frizzled-related protein 4 n=1 Tax=Patella vulgata TaxID=6465 RepID=UPI00217FD5D9|nr:secreted frizzled-related protein 4 [Patella vulgata]
MKVAKDFKLMSCLIIILCLLELTNCETRRRQRRPNRRRRPNSRRRTTLPTTTTDNSTPVQCETIFLPMCRGLVGYRRTHLPNQFGHTTQMQVYRSLEYLWPFMDIGCSRNFRVLACGMYLPKCPGNTGVEGGLKPCKETCRRARRCRTKMRELQSEWPTDFNCNTLLPRKSKKCIPPVSERPRCANQHVTCQRNEHDFCQGLNFPLGMLPNMFLQCSKQDIHRELDEYRVLIDSGCSEHLAFLLCGIYQPFCTRAENPFALPCREICELVKSDCESTYSRLFGGLPWPGKLQCHRYPLSTDELWLCAMPGDTSLALTPEEALANGEISENGENSEN